MSLDTLLEAAKYIELKEMMEKQNQAAQIAPSIVVTTANGTIKHPVLQKPLTSVPAAQQTLVITSHHLPGAAQSVIHTPAASSAETSSPSSSSGATCSKKVETANRTRFIHNSFDIINTLYIDEKGNAPKRKPPPLVFRAGTREVHNKLEKHRRAHLRECFDMLKKQLPASPDEKKSSNLNILHSAIRYIHVLRKKERDLEQEMERLAREKISFQTKLALLKKDISCRYENIDFNRLLADVEPSSQEGNHSSRDSESDSSIDVKDEDTRSSGLTEDQRSTLVNTNGVKKLSLPILPSNSQGPVTSTVTSIKEVQQPVQTALSVVPVGYPLNQGGLVLQKLLVPKGITPIMPTFITQQQLNGKVVPLVNAQYVVGKCPLVVVSTANPRPS